MQTYTDYTDSFDDDTRIQRVINYTQGELVPSGATPVGYELPETATFEMWCADGRKLNMLDKWKNFAIGDWLLQGSDRFGEVCYQEVDEFGWGSHDKLKKLVWVARNVPRENRDMSLTWTHHHHVASLPIRDQRRWLERAVSEELTSDELKSQIAIIRGDKLPPPALSLSEPEEAPFNHETRWGAPTEQRTAVDEYEQQADSLAGSVTSYDWASPEEDRPRPHVTHNSGNNEWYTPSEYIEAARRVLGAIDLDPASSDEANKVVRAASHYTVDTDGLAHAWSGRVWMNPPYSTDLVSRFSEKLIYHFDNCEVDQAIVLVNNATETQWFQALAFHASAICFPAKRIRFWSPDGTPGAPLQGQAILYLGGNTAAFLGEFERFGLLTEVK